MRDLLMPFILRWYADEFSRSGRPRTTLVRSYSQDSFVFDQYDVCWHETDPWNNEETTGLADVFVITDQQLPVASKHEHPPHGTVFGEENVVVIGYANFSVTVCNWQRVLSSWNAVAFSPNVVGSTPDQFGDDGAEFASLTLSRFMRLFSFNSNNDADAFAIWSRVPNAMADFVCEPSQVVCNSQKRPVSLVSALFDTATDPVDSGDEERTEE